MPICAEAIEGYVRTLGRQVEQRWATHRNNEEFFPQVARGALSDVEVPECADAIALMEFVTSRQHLPPQEDLGFGDPPVTLYRGRDFYISALYWLEGTTSIHQHSFSGAFRLLEGSSIHASYAFAQGEVVNRRLLLGDLTFGGAELLEAGDVREIAAGNVFIHSLFHLERPSVTLVVRTIGEDLGTPQFAYLRPGLAYDPLAADEAQDRQLDGLRTLHAIAPDAALRTAKEMVTATDFLGGFLVARRWFRLDRSERAYELVEHFIRRHGPAAEILRPAFAELHRQRGIILRRR